ncbi:hypothetical protein QCA50_021206 [Cerrena zonata]|uniref:CBM21 domain-containing protein n=1 Tax=Cerrena zonata TaxID=2478898 RepID=A0AAW0FBM3_9APHY
MTSAAVYNPPPSYLMNSYVYMDRSYNRDSNTASAPLPRIPRRTPPTSRTPSIVGTSAVTTLQSLFVSPSQTQTKLVIHPPTPPSLSFQSVSSEAKPEHRDDASSSSGSESYVEMSGSKRRTRVAPKHLVCPPEQSTPTPALLTAKSEASRIAWPSRKSSDSETARDDDTPRASSSKKGSHLRLDLTELQQSSAGFSSEGAPATAPAPVIRPMALSLGRKKSGEPLKSSLKSRRPIVRGDLSVVTGPMAVKSEPSTPTHIKSVHFDAQLEHVKLFLAEQKPLAISREGSPTDDTSGTDSDFPSFIYGGISDEERTRRSLAINVTNLPPRISDTAEVALESLTLSDDGSSIHGKVRVQNIAFEKWVAVRFTFDWWQTTSEVTARYVESIPGGVFDRFAFSIRLNDMLKRIEDKTLFLAVRYTAAGRELWDNNGGQNYQVKFAKKKQPPSGLGMPKLTLQKLSTSTDSSSAPSPGELHNRLEEVASSKGLSPRTGMSRRTVSASDSFTLRSGVPLSSRYDFSASLKSPWKAGSPFSEERPRTNTHPSFSRRASPDKKTLDAKFITRGSPRIADNEDSTPSGLFYTGSDSEGTPVPQTVLSRRIQPRNHQRGYFDLGVASTATAVKRTPPSTPPAPRSEPAFRYNSFPPTNGSSPSVPVTVSEPREEYLSPKWHLTHLGGSEESTPSISSNSESSQSSSATSSPMYSPADKPAQLYADDIPEASSYSMFLNRFCFYTGSDSMLDVPIDALQRSHSASSVEELLSSPNPSGNYHLSPGHTPTRSSSYDDVACMSGSGTTTPTPSVAFVH